MRKIITNNIKEINLMSEKYRKYLTSVKYDNKLYYFVFGTDLNNDSIDYIVIDSLNRMLFYDSIDNLIKYIYKDSSNSYDSKNFHIWISQIRNHIDHKLEYSYAFYNIDFIYSAFIQKSMLYINKLKRKNLEEFINFINLVNDYALQTENKYLRKLTKDDSIRSLWDYYYNIDIWMKEKESSFEFLFKNFNEINFRINLAKIFSIFVSKIHFVTK